MKTPNNLYFFLTSIFVLFISLYITPVFAHRSPVACTGSGLSISLFVSPSQAQVGDIVSYSADVFNGIGAGPVICDATNIQASIITPDGVTHPIALVRTSLSNAEIDTYSNVVTYTIRQQDIQNSTVAATGHVTGAIHQNDIDSQGGGDQGINVQIAAAVSSPTTSGPSHSGRGGSCAYGFNFDLMRCNYTPLVPVPSVVSVIPVVPILPNAGLIPDSGLSFLVNVAQYVGAFLIINTSPIIDVQPQVIYATMPARLVIPSIGVDTDIESVGLTAKGALDVPEDITNAGWFNDGPKPGKIGNAVIDGHYGWKDKIPAVFDNLRDVKRGDKIYVIDERGASTTFIVKEIRTYGEAENAPEIFVSTDGESHLNLITCHGSWNRAKQSYVDRLVVFADKVGV
ncbi:MAG: class F sortase [bacterium]|nr:class F sortase [bacterium]